MAKPPLRLCPVCRRHSYDPTKGRRCDKCAAPKDLRPSARERGYDARWERARADYLARHPLCAEGLRQWRSELATVVDHVRPHRGNRERFWSAENWQGLCEECHNRKTGREANLGMYARYVVTGPPGAGKTTWVNRRRKPGDVVWDYDQVAATILGLPEKDCPPDMIPIVHRIGLSLIEEIATNPPQRTVFIILANPSTAAIAAERLSGRLITLDRGRVVSDLVT